MLAVYLLLLLVSTTLSCVARYPSECFCGLPLNKRRIIGGVTAKPKQYPWQVGLMNNINSEKSFCGGSLLSSDTVLTAAHCVQYQSSVIIAFPQDDVSLKDGIKIRSSEIRIHPDYSSRGAPNNDFAIVKLSRPVTFDDTVSPICLPNPTLSYKGKLAEVTGWGNTKPNGFNIPEDLQTVNVTTMSNEECNKLFKDQTGEDNQITKDMICAADPGKDSCQGDSGGPLITLSDDGMYYSQIGVVSWGFGCASKTPGVYARVTEQLYWIMQQVSGEACNPKMS